MSIFNLPASRPAVVLMCGLPTSGKTTTAARLHDHVGGTLIHSFHIYEAMGIVVADWVERTRGFTVEVEEYDRLRDAAYVEMARQVGNALDDGTPLVIVDFAFPDSSKRRALYDICLSHGAHPVVLRCRCDDSAEVRRRFAARRGRESEGEHEASDLSVLHDIQRRWQDPVDDLIPGGTRPSIVE